MFKAFEPAPVLDRPFLYILLRGDEPVASDFGEGEGKYILAFQTSRDASDWLHAHGRTTALKRVRIMKVDSELLASQAARNGISFAVRSVDGDWQPWVVNWASRTKAGGALLLLNEGRKR